MSLFMDVRIGRKGWQLMDVNWRMDENVPNRDKLEWHLERSLINYGI
jgi:hypothetical protein